MARWRSYARITILACVLATPPALASVSIYMPPEHLAQRAVLVVEGQVVRTASGFDPQTSRLATYVTLNVDVVHRGPRDLDTLILREPGGRVGQRVHAADAVPVYLPGERVFVFLEPAHDGALRTTGMFYGKYTLDPSASGSSGDAARDLQGQGRIFGHVGPLREVVALSDLVAVTASISPAAAVRRPAESRRAERRGNSAAPRMTFSWTAVPTELNGLIWEEERKIEARPTVVSLSGDRLAPAAPRPTPSSAPRFAPLSESSPVRWEEVDDGTPVPIRVELAGNPLGDGAAAVEAIARALDAWTVVPESRLELRIVDDDYDYTGQYPQSPRVYYSGINAVLFDDPYDDIPDPTNCSGVLAIGGYWNTTSGGSTVNNVSFYPARQLYVIFNNGFECFLSDPDNLAEVAAHELGHGLGFGHSSTSDAILRAFAYGNRGPRLGDDDRDAAHCHYPHHFEITRPISGAQLEVGALEPLEWTATSEAGSDSGVVDLEYSVDGGTTWNPVASAQPNDGFHTWLVPDDVGDDARVRVIRHNRGNGVPSVYPEGCSQATSEAFRIVPATPVAGSLPSDGPGALRLERLDSGELVLRWGASCSVDVDDYAIYEGSLETLRAGSLDPVPLTCSAGPDLGESIGLASADRYYLVAPLAGSSEGSYGTSSGGIPRPSATLSCAVRESFSTCE